MNWWSWEISDGGHCCPSTNFVRINKFVNPISNQFNMVHIILFTNEFWNTLQYVPIDFSFSIWLLLCFHLSFFSFFICLALRLQYRVQFDSHPQLWFSIQIATNFESTVPIHVIPYLSSYAIRFLQNPLILRFSLGFRLFYSKVQSIYSTNYYYVLNVSVSGAIIPKKWIRNYCIWY